MLPMQRPQLLLCHVNCFVYVFNSHVYCPMMMGMMDRDFGLNGPSYEAASQVAEHRKMDNVRVLQAAEGAVNSAGPALTCDYFLSLAKSTLHPSTISATLLKLLFPLTVYYYRLTFSCGGLYLSHDGNFYLYQHRSPMKW